MQRGWQEHVLEQSEGAPVLAQVAPLGASQQHPTSCADIALAVGAVGAPRGELNIGAMAAALPPAEELHSRVSHAMSDPKEAAAHHPGVRHLGDCAAMAVPRGSLPAALAAGLFELSMLSPAQAVLEALDRLRSTSGFLTVTAREHCIALLRGKRFSDGSCRQLFLVNGLGSWLHPASLEASSSSSSEGYVLCIEGGSRRAFQQRLTSVLDWQLCGRYQPVDDWRAVDVRTALKRLQVSVDVFTTGKPQVGNTRVGYACALLVPACLLCLSMIVSCRLTYSQGSPLRWQQGPCLSLRVSPHWRHFLGQHSSSSSSGRMCCAARNSGRQLELLPSCSHPRRACRGHLSRYRHRQRSGACRRGGRHCCLLHQVSLQHARCSCPDSTGLLCKHIRAVAR